MSNDQATIEHFKQHMSQIDKQHPLNELDFLYLCKEAVDLTKVAWDEREVIAERITHIWLRHSDELSDDAKMIGGLFADLDLPDAHIDTNQGLTIPELWEQLDSTVMLSIHNKLHKPSRD